MKFRSISLLILASVLLMQASTANALQAFAITESELVMMPPWCQAKYGKDRDNEAVKDRWRQIYGDQNWRNMHHYCDALKYIVRANRSVGDKAELSFNLEKAQQGLEHLLTAEQTPDWILRPEAHVNLGKVDLRMVRFGKASEGQVVQNFEKAISIQPEYEPAYSALSDYYFDKGLKQKALQVTEDGLRHAPDSKALLRRFKQLGGKTPPASLAVIPPPAPDEATNSPARQAQTGSSAGALPTDTPAPPAPSAPKQQATPTKIGIPSDPWCRFCPDIDNSPPAEHK